MIFNKPASLHGHLRIAIDKAYLADETLCVEALLAECVHDEEKKARIQKHVRKLVQAVRKYSRDQGGLDALLHEYDLSSQEGVVLMCLAEALLRIPDSETADQLIRDKLASGEWGKHLGQSHSLFVNASTWGLMLTGKVVDVEQEAISNIGGFIHRIIARSSEPVVRMAIKQAMRILGQQFVMGRSIEEALARSKTDEHRDYRHSYDMLGEAALTQADAERYALAYAEAIKSIAQDASSESRLEDTPQESIFARPSISVKLSALHPRYEYAQHERVMAELVPRLLELAVLARQCNVGLTLDAEEAEYLDLSLNIFEALFQDGQLASWEGLGLALQAYQKRATAVLDWLIDLSRTQAKRIPLRLVKGAYWDAEIKHGQKNGLEGYPVFTRKASTDVAYLVCVKRIFDARDAIYPQFATHNAHTLAALLEIAGRRRDFELQRLHGMGEVLYREALNDDRFKLPCRVYAPVGSHQDLLPYLVRRLLENGANTSFVNRLEDERAPIEDVIADPVQQVRSFKQKAHPRIPLPRALYTDRVNSQGLNLSSPLCLEALASEMDKMRDKLWKASPLIAHEDMNGEVMASEVMVGKAHPVYEQADGRRQVGSVVRTDETMLTRAIEQAHAAQKSWDDTAADMRAEYLERAASLFEEHRPELMALCIREAGKTLADALAEVREAADFCRYYAMMARKQFSGPEVMIGPTGEYNEVQRHGRGVFACISPWNFPLAIFVGQVSAALAAGNSVIAKPAESTSLIAFRAIELMHQAGIPAEVLHLVPGSGQTLGAILAADERIAGIAFTGSTETAWTINRTLASRDSAIVPFIAETGGQNAMIVDSSALPEQVVKDVIRSAFNSAGQRCSALRVLFIQEDVAPKILEMLSGAMAELRIGDPGLLATDIGPVIDVTARDTLKKHVKWLKQHGRLIYECPLPKGAEQGLFFAPHAFEIDEIGMLKREVFGPILHVIRYGSDQLDKVIEDINNTRYGLTLGIHTRIDNTARYIQSRVKAGNAYINRDMVGAVVGVQPFGGEGLSGTGPKAGGPDYLSRFSVERTVSVNTTAVGGNASLLSLRE